MNGLFQEIGPCRITNDSSTIVDNPYSWTNDSNVLFIDQPLGTGFSVSHSPLKITTSQEAAADVWKFLQIFFSDSRFSSLASKKLALWTQS
jgi:carboxypeptidase C (cathepsin A)